MLLSALRKGFEAANRARAEYQNGSLQQKAIIFTESRRTQEYLLRLLESSEFSGKIVLFNGTNSDSKSAEIYRNWQARHQGTDRITGSPTADAACDFGDGDDPDLAYDGRLVAFLSALASGCGASVGAGAGGINYDGCGAHRSVKDSIRLLLSAGQGERAVYVLGYCGWVDAAGRTLFQL